MIRKTSKVWDPDELNAAIADRFKALREQAGLSQHDISKRISEAVAQPQVSVLERASRRWNVDHLAHLAAALGVSPADLMPVDDADGDGAMMLLSRREAQLIGALRDRGELSALVHLAEMMEKAAHAAGEERGKRFAVAQADSTRSEQGPEERIQDAMAIPIGPMTFSQQIKGKDGWRVELQWPHARLSVSKDTGILEVTPGVLRKGEPAKVFVSQNSVSGLFLDIDDNIVMQQGDECRLIFGSSEMAHVQGIRAMISYAVNLLELSFESTSLDNVVPIKKKTGIRGSSDFDDDPIPF